MSKTRSYFTYIVPLFGIAFPTCISCPILQLLPPKSTLAFSPPPSTHFLPLMPISYPQSLLHRRHAKSALCVSASLNAAPAYKWTSDAIYAETLSPVPVWRNIFFSSPEVIAMRIIGQWTIPRANFPPSPFSQTRIGEFFFPPSLLCFAKFFISSPNPKLGLKEICVRARNNFPFSLC